MVTAVLLADWFVFFVTQRGENRLENSWSPEAYVNEYELYSVSEAGGTMV